MTLRQAGGPLGVALLGSLLADGYTDRLDTSDLPAPAAEAARESIAGAIAVATRLRQPDQAASTSSAFLHGMTLVLIATAITAGISAALTAALLPGRPADDSTPAPTTEPASTKPRREALSRC